MANSVPRYSLTNSLTETIPFSSCDTLSFIYLCLALALIATGSFAVLISTEESKYFSKPFVNYWFFGPLCICCALMLASKALIHIRKRTLTEYLARLAMAQSADILESASANNNNTHNRARDNWDNVSQFSLPPPYESVIASLNSEKETV